MATLDKGVINFDRVRPAVSSLRTFLRYVEKKGIEIVFGLPGQFSS